MSKHPAFPLSRRQVLRAGLYGLGACAAMPTLFARAATAWAADGTEAHPERILVVVELDGGNDGLNTVVPYGDDAYYRQRPSIGIPAKDVLRIDDHFGFHPSMGSFQRLYGEGKLAVVHGCGYENPILSHFAAMGFWHTGVPHGGETLGWVGRIADAMRPDGAENLIVNIGKAQSLAVRSRVHAPLVFDDPDRFLREGRHEQVPVLAQLTGDRDSPNATLAYLSEVAESARKSAAFVRQAWRDYRTPVSYGLELPLSQDLRKVAALIDAGMPTRLYYVKYRGNSFDTHVHQVDLHARLLTYAVDAMDGFLEDIARLGRANEVAMMVFTEFGRRVPENASGGTDHGTATPMFVAGHTVKGGQYGAPPSLTELDDGNLIYTTDFRRVYATMIGEWLGRSDTAELLRGDFTGLNMFG